WHVTLLLMWKFIFSPPATLRGSAYAWTPGKMISRCGGISAFPGVERGCAKPLDFKSATPAIPVPVRFRNSRRVLLAIRGMLPKDIARKKSFDWGVINRKVIACSPRFVSNGSSHKNNLTQYD